MKGPFRTFFVLNGPFMTSGTALALKFRAMRTTCCESHFRNLQRCESGFRNLLPPPAPHPKYVKAPFTALDAVKGAFTY